MNKRFLTALAVSASIMGTALPAKALVLTFEGLSDQQAVNNYYNGGSGGSYGISFVNAYSATETSVGGSAPYSTEPSRYTTMAFYNPGSGLWNTGVMNVSGGFNSSISLYYSSPNVPVMVTVYDGLNGGGTNLASVNLTNLNPYTSFIPVTINFIGTAHSVSFSGVNGYPAAYDNISLNPVPEPSALLLLGSGVMAFGWYGRRRQSAQS